MEREGRKFLKCCSFLLAILTMLNNAKASVYTVGDEEEWSDQTNFASWAARYNFSVGDVLVFKYVKGKHNANEVTEGTYRSCDASSGVLVKYESGEDQVVLTQVKTYWFICSVAGHCLGGMRFGIQVKQGNSTNTTNSAPQIQPPLSDNSCPIYVPQRWRVISYFVCFGLLLKLGY